MPTQFDTLFSEYFNSKDLQYCMNADA